MRVLIAPDSFKDCCSATAAAEALARGVRAAMPSAEIDCCPIADGGEGTVEVFAAAVGGEWRTSSVHGPMVDGPRADAAWLMLPGGSAAAAEMASAAGLPLVPQAERNPYRTTSYGVGELLRAMALALDSSGGEGKRTIYLGLGGSATVDGGAGLAQALGVRLYDAEGIELTEAASGANLGRIASLDLAALLGALPGQPEVVALVDVDNPLLGARGAARQFGPQKGASATQVQELEAGLARFSDVVRASTGVAVADLAGAGAAGGLAVALVGLFGARIQPGAAALFELAGLDERLARADAVISGEGAFDSTSLGGKGAGSVLRRALRAGKDAILVAGRIDMPAGELNALGLRRAYALIDRARSPRDSMERTLALLQEAGYLYGLFEARRQPGRPGAPPLG